MKWITATDLALWSKRTEARATLIDMVADLIRAGAPNTSYFRFPGGDKAQVRGFDGDLECEKELEFVPGKLSKWEFGVSPGSAKAKSDYDKRTNQTPTDVRSQNTLVLVNLNTWDSPTEKLSDWVQARKREGGWLDVRYIDGVQLEHWFDLHPAVAARYARYSLNLAPVHGVQSIDEFWDSYSCKFKPNIKEAVLTCDRDEQVAGLLQRLSGTPQSFMYGAESAEDVVAFAVAAIRSASPEIRMMLEARTLIVESVEAVRFLLTRKGLVFITRDAADAHAGELGARGPTLSAAIGVQARNEEKLIRPSASSLGKALQTMGLNIEDAYQLAMKCGRSITILHRQIPNGPYTQPEWVKQRSDLLPAILAGGWSTTSSLDKDVLAKLSELKNYSRFEASLREMLEFKDPPIDRVNDVWQVRAPVDAFPYFTGMIGEDELRLFKEAAVTVFSKEVILPKAEDKYQVDFKAPDAFSSWLRDGLAFTLLQFATVAGAAGLHIPNQTPQQFVNEVINDIPEWGRSHKTLIALKEQLATIAEAAPDAFLSALEFMLKGDAKEMLGVFDESEDFFSPSSPHVSLLFALEVLAWDPIILPRVCSILAGLASIDPGGKLTNRPVNSLRSILLPWSPNTYASFPERLECVDNIVRSYSDVGWRFLLKLLPRGHDTTSPTKKPMLRDVTPRNPEVLTFGIVWESNSRLIERAIEAAGFDEGRLLELIKNIASFAPADRVPVLERVDEFLRRNPSDEGRPLWHELKRKILHHETYATAEWALPGNELELFKELLCRYAPKDLVATKEWLFNDWLPVKRDDNGSGVDSSDIARVEALNSIKVEVGMQGVIKLFYRVKLPHLVIQAMPDSVLDLHDYTCLLDSLMSDEKKNIQYVANLSGVGFFKFSVDWESYIAAKFPEGSKNPEFLANLFLSWPSLSKTWTIVASLGEDVERAYWEKIGVLCRNGSDEEYFHSIEMFRKAGRSFEVIELSFEKLDKIPGQLMLALLDEGINDLNDSSARDGTMARYYLQKAFETLQLKGDVTLEEVALREYSYLPLLDGDGNKLLLHKFMADSPAFYFEVVSKVFRRDDVEPGELSESDRLKASLSYRLLDSFYILPGLADEKFDESELNKWVVEVRALSLIGARVDITDQYIGRLLAHGPADPSDGLWPHVYIRRLLESLRNDNVETGVAIERFNMRGVHMRAFFEGGDQERELAQQYNRWADGMNGFVRVNRLLLSIASDWARQAVNQDVRAEQTKLKH